MIPIHSESIFQVLNLIPYVFLLLVISAERQEPEQVMGVALYRWFRATSVLRVVRLTSYFQDLWFVAMTFLYSVKPLLWTVCFIFLLVFVAAHFVECFLNSSGDGSATLLELETMTLDLGSSRLSSVLLLLVRMVTFDDWVRTAIALWEIAEDPICKWTLISRKIDWTKISASNNSITRWQLANIQLKFSKF